MDRYTIYHDMFDAMPRWLVVDRTMGSYDRDGSDRHVASCPDPEMAQRIADLLNGEDAKKRFDAAVRSYTEVNHA